MLQLPTCIVEETTLLQIKWFMKEECLAWPTNIGQTIHTPVHAFHGDSYFIIALFDILQRPACT